MPIYEYECQACGERVEVLQRVSDEPLAECESCGGELKRLISPPAFQFKGSGWYVTDYARKGSGDGKKAAEGSGDSERTSEKASEKNGASKASEGKTSTASSSADD